MIELPKFLPSYESLDKDAMAYYGLLGDYVGGVFGTLAAVVTLIFVYRTWRTTQQVQLRSGTFQILAEMLDTHEEIVSSIRLNAYVGRDAFVQILSEFYAIYRLVVAADKQRVLTQDQRIDVAYTFMYYGPQLLATVVLEHYGKPLIKTIADSIHLERVTEQSSKRTFKGHQNRLSHYYRNIYGAFEFIDRSMLPLKEKQDISKVYRTKLSNYEQALLALNVISHLGRPWEDNLLLSRYQPIKNIPIAFFTFDREFKLKERFPYINFEWESHNGIRPWAWKRDFGSVLVYCQLVGRRGR